MTIFSINQISIRQSIVPARLLGRVNATRRVLVFGMQPIASVAAGLLGASVGLVPTLTVAVAVEALALLAIWPLARELKEVAARR